MEKKTLVVILALLAAGGGAYLYFKNKDKQETTTSDKTTNDISDRETQQAMQLYNMLGVEKTGGLVWRLATIHDIPEEKVLNIMLEVTNWPKLQEKFRGMCNNEYSLSKALSDGLTVDEYNTAIQYASAKKVVTTQDNTQVTLIDGVTPKMVKFVANTVVGALTTEQDDTYSFINEVKPDGNLIVGAVQKSNAKLM